MAAAPGNKYAIGNQGGRPAIFESPEALATEVDTYFEYIKGESHKEKSDVEGLPDFEVWDRRPEPATITGLSLFLGFANRVSLSDYAEKSNEFSNIIKRAKARVEHEYEKCLFAQSPAGAIFALKNMGWNDTTNLNHGGQDGKNPILTHTVPQITITNPHASNAEGNKAD